MATTIRCLNRACRQPYRVTGVLPTCRRCGGRRFRAVAESEPELADPLHPYVLSVLDRKYLRQLRIANGLELTEGCP
jgi:hypothetical protein